MRLISVMAAAAALGAPLAASAQEADDWDVTREPERPRVTASVIYSNGVGVAARCAWDTYEVLLAGLPPVDEDDDGITRTLRIGMDDAPPVAQSWMRGDTPTVAFSQLPARFARTLREGGLLTVITPAEGDRAESRITIEIPPSPAAIDETLTACRKPLTDTRTGDPGWVVSDQPNPLRWRVRPRPRFPARAASAGVMQGLATLSCVSAPDGRLEQCEVESELPTGLHLGREALRAVVSARLQTPDGSPITPSIVTFNIRYQMGG